MCTELPVELSEVRPDATARGWVGGRATGRLTDVSLVLLDGPAVAGDWVVAHAGFALHRISAAAAQDALAIHAGALLDRLPAGVRSEADRVVVAGAAPAGMTIHAGALPDDLPAFVSSDTDPVPVVTGAAPEPISRTANAPATPPTEASVRPSDGSTRKEPT